MVPFEAVVAAVPLEPLVASSKWGFLTSPLSAFSPSSSDFLRFLTRWEILAAAFLGLESLLSPEIKDSNKLWTINRQFCESHSVVEKYCETRKNQHFFFVKSTFFFTEHSVEKCYKMRSWFLRKNQHFFRQINMFTKEVTKEMISRKIFEGDRVF